ncbi:MAG: Stp1/IreP family PP2C-type Ser/Thr phosphatase [Bacilli bacterium]|jgi:protein phosphatase|nr:Stp1/IreP family PP2C-type Ser/Thr phosphatase [Bacilli bacterium]
MRNDYSGSFAFRTDIGKVRQSNEDQAFVGMGASGEVFLVVCDGMGGANKGDVASKIAVDSLASSFKRKHRHLLAASDRFWITKATKAANRAIFNEAESNPAYKGMGTTMVAALISGRRLLIANIGDSRAYVLKDGRLRQLTEDQTYVQYLLNTGKITPEQALSHPERHVLMNALGINPSVSLTLSSRPYRGETLLLCSDGVYNSIPVPAIETILSTDERADQKAMSLINEANANGGSDNEGVAYWEASIHDSRR